MFLFTIWHLNSSPFFMCTRMLFRRFSAVLVSSILKVVNPPSCFVRVIAVKSKFKRNKCICHRKMPLYLQLAYYLHQSFAGKLANQNYENHYVNNNYNYYYISTKYVKTAGRFTKIVIFSSLILQSNT
jgi:hypothetical protein